MAVGFFGRRMRRSILIYQLVQSRFQSFSLFPLLERVPSYKPALLSLFGPDKLLDDLAHNLRTSASPGPSLVPQGCYQT